MKLFLNSFVFLFLFGWPVLGVEIKKDYVVKVGGIKIGELNGMPIGAQLLGSPGLDWSFCKWICALDLAYTSKEE